MGILFGGRSGEHEVSLVSAASVIKALNPQEFEITAIGITKTGKLADASETRAMLPPDAQSRVLLCDSLEAHDSRIRLTSSSADGRENGRPALDIIFPLLHGPYGEDGTIQGLLEIAGLPYVGCGVLASAVGMDKDVMKRLFVQAGLPTLPYRTYLASDVVRRFDSIKKFVDESLGYPVFSKPANLGSSVGVCKIHAENELKECLGFSAQFDRKILIEKGIDARELECGVLGNDDPKASVVGEIFPSREFYDYQAKYVDPDSRLEIPARILDRTAEEIRSLALRAFQTIDGSGLARVDFFLERSTEKVWLNELNTMPGFTPISMYAKLWQASGTGFAELVHSLVQLGLERHHERNEQRVC